MAEHVEDTTEAFKDHLDEQEWESVLGDRNKGDVLETFDPTTFNVGEAEFITEHFIVCAKCGEYFYPDDGGERALGCKGEFVCDDCAKEGEGS